MHYNKYTILAIGLIDDYDCSQKSNITFFKL